MSDDPRPAPLFPVTWAVPCPDCGAQVDIDESQVSEDDHGAWRVDGPDAFPHCQECGCFIAVQPVTVREAYPDETP